MNAKRIILLISLFTINKITFSQSLQSPNQKALIQDNMNVMDSVNRSMHQIGEVMKLKLSNGEVKSDKDLNQKEFIIEKSSSIKIEIIKEGSKP